jgi:hypothetical protein
VKLLRRDVPISIKRSEAQGMRHIVCAMDVDNNYKFAKLNFPQLNMNLPARYEASYFIIFSNYQLPQ